MTLNIPCRSIPMPYYKYINPKPDYENMPITFAPLSGAGDIRMMLNGSAVTTLPSDYHFYYKKSTDSDWKPYIPTRTNQTPPTSSVIHLNEGQSVSFSGAQDKFNTSWSGVKNTFSSSVEFKCYGRLDSLTNGSCPQYVYAQGREYGPYAWTFLNQDNNGKGYYNNNIVNFRNLILPYPSSKYCFIGFFEDNASISSTPVFRYSTNDYNYHQIFKHNGGGYPSQLVMQFAFDIWYNNDWQNQAWANIPTYPVFIVPSGCNYVSTLTSIRSNAKIVYRNENGLFYNNQQINEDVLLDTGEIVNV